MMFNDVSLQVVPGGRQGVHGQGVEDHPKAEPEVELEEKKGDLDGHSDKIN